MAAQNLGRANVGRGKKKPDPRVEMMKQLVKDDFGKDVPQIYRCTRCGFTTTNELAKFSNVYSQIYASNDFRLSVCKNCLDDLYEKYYRPKCESDEEAVRVLCQKFDIYYNPSIVQMMKEGARPNKHFSFYVQKTSLQQYANKTYDTTIQEEKELSANVDKIEDIERNEVDENTVKFWGFGFNAEDYEYLDERYVAWSTCYNINSEAMSSIFKNICVIELQILKGIQNGEKVDALYRQMNDFMNSAGVQPKQSSENTLSDSASFGVLIKRWEDEKPIPEPEPEWQDVDGIIRYIGVWFFGHLCAMFHFKNKWSDLYEREIKKYSAEKIDWNSTEVDAVSYDDIFGNNGDDV